MLLTETFIVEFLNGISCAWRKMHYHKYFLGVILINGNNNFYYNNSINLNIFIQDYCISFNLKNAINAGSVKKN